MSSPPPNAASVRLPSRSEAAPNGNRPPVWAISDSAEPSVSTPLPAKCSRHQDDREGVCCKDLKGDDERELVNPDIIRDIVIGLSDGLTVPFALTAGLSSLGESKLVVLGGVAELIAGAISMGIGGFLASQAERDHYRYLRRQTNARVLRSCDGEMEREVHAVLGPVGVEEKVSRQVARNLMEVEVGEHAISRTASSSANASEDEESGGLLKWSQDVGITAFLLKFSEGLEEVPTRRLYLSALTIGMGYLLGGLIPLLPYFCIARAHVALVYSCIFTGIVLLIFGAVKSYITGAGRGTRDYIWGAVSTLLVGGAAAGAAYGIVALLEPKA